MLTEVLLVLSSNNATFGSLLDGEADAATLKVEVDDLDPEFFAWRDDLLGKIDVVRRHFRNVHEAFDAVANLHEGTERNELGDTAVDEFANLMGGGEFLPRILLGGLERKADALAVEIDLEDLHVDLVADGNDRTGMIDMLPGQLGHVHEAVHATEVDEGTEVDNGGDHTAADLAGLEVREEVVALFLLGLFEPRTTGEHNVVAVLVEFDDLGVDGATHVGGKVTHTAQFDQRCGQEAAQTDVDDEAALDDLDDRAADDTLFFLDLLDRAPGPLVLCALLGQDETTFLVLLGEDERFDALTERDDLGWVDIVADREFAGRNDTLGLVADVEENLIVVDLDDRAFDDLAILHLHHRGRVRLVKRLCTEIVLDDLTRDVAALGVEAAHAVRFGAGGVGSDSVGGRGCGVSRVVGELVGQGGSLFGG
ncbi:unannotated protein [freshwater metagenome]|uniref:Unannotated protein n=1 Tax=freshwater metagenome TaxID=449393 RepID=A0A6J5YLC0_9ZZZZ